METQKKSDFTKGLKIALLVLLAAWALFRVVYLGMLCMGSGLDIEGIRLLFFGVEIVAGVLMLVALLTFRNEKNKGILWGLFVVEIVLALLSIWIYLDIISFYMDFLEAYWIESYYKKEIFKCVLGLANGILVVVCGGIALTCRQWEKVRIGLGICAGIGVFVGLYMYGVGMGGFFTGSIYDFIDSSYVFSEMCFVMAMSLFYVWVARKRCVSTEEEPRISMFGGQAGAPTQYASVSSGGLSAGTRNGMASLVKGGGTCCLLGMIVGSFLPIFAVSGFNFAMVLWGMVSAAGDSFMQGVMGLLGYTNIELKAWLIVIGIVVLYLLEWKAFRKALDYPFHKGYGWNIWLLLSSAAGAIFFCTVKFWFDFIGMGRRDVAGIGLIVLQWSHIILFVLSIMAIIVKNDYNKEQLRKKKGAQEQTYGTSFSTTVARTTTPVPAMPTSPIASVSTMPARTMAAPIQNVVSGRFCTKCGQPLVGDAVFCGECGAKVEEKIVCKGCGKERIGAEKFCTKCGTKFEIEVNATESVVSEPVVSASGPEVAATLLGNMPEAEEVASTLQQDVAEEEEDLFTQAFVALESGEFWKAEGLSKQILRSEPNNAMSYVVALMVQRQIRRKKELATGTRPLTEYELFRHAMSLAAGELKEELESYNRAILDGNMDRAYSNACETKSLAEKAEKYELKIRRLDEAIAQFDKLEGWKDSAVQIELCESQKLAFTKQVYDGAKERMQKATEDGLSLKQQMALFRTAADEFKMIESSYDSEQLYEECMKQKTECEKTLKAKKRKKIFIFVGVVGIVAVVGLGSVLVCNAIEEQKRQEKMKQEQYDADYAKMQEQIAQGRYEDAIETMTSSVAYSKAEKMVQEAVYELANEYVDEKMYEKAEEAYSWLGDYEDCEERREKLPELEFLLYAEVKKDTSDGTYTLVKVDKEKAPSVVVVPGKVSQIAAEAFAGCAKIEEIVLPDGVTYIGDGAFKGCDNLKSIVIPSGVKNIGKEVFSRCSSLNSISLPTGLASIGTAAFYGCGSLCYIVIPDSVVSIGEEAFSNCSNLSSINLSAGLTSIERLTFNGCRKLSNVTIPKGVTSIENRAFYGCSSLKSINLPAGLTSIGWYAFSGCSSLSGIYIPSSVVSIGGYAFNGCKGINRITIPSGVAEIEKGTFNDCGCLDNVNLQTGIVTIGENAFKGCSNLSGITIPSSVTQIKKEAFSNCSSLVSVKIPSSVINVEEGAFSGCSKLSSVDILYGVTNIGDSMFSGCSNLYNITIPESVTSIGSYAFESCSSLNSITIPESVTSIGKYAFYYCSNLNNVIIPESVINIGAGAFCNCKNLSNITLPNGITNIEYDLFKGCNSLNGIKIPESVTGIGKWAFARCSGLRNVEIPSNVTSVGYGAFSDCWNLINITLPHGITIIEYRLFDGCISLSSIEVPESVTSIEGNAFEDCISLTSIKIPSGVTEISDDSFYGSNPELILQVESDSYAHWYAKSYGFLYETY